MIGDRALPKKWYGGKRQANTGSAGALARYEREARNSYGVKKFEIERAAHAPAGEGARAPSTNRLVPYRIDFLGKAGSARDFDMHDSAYMRRSHLFFGWHSTHWNIEMSPRFTGCWKGLLPWWQNSHL